MYKDKIGIKRGSLHSKWLWSKMATKTTCRANKQMINNLSVRFSRANTSPVWVLLSPSEPTTCMITVSIETLVRTPQYLVMYIRRTRVNFIFYETGLEGWAGVRLEPINRRSLAWKSGKVWQQAHGSVSSLPGECAILIHTEAGDMLLGSASKPYYFFFF